MEDKLPDLAGVHYLRDGITLAESNVTATGLAGWTMWPSPRAFGLVSADGRGL